jgi:hypothetical protein
MGLLNKRNPRATRNSVIRMACVGAASGFLFALFALTMKEQTFEGALCWLPCMTIGGALIGTLMEWDGPPS